MNPIGRITACLILSIVGAHGALRGELPEFANVRYERGVLVVTTTTSQALLLGQIGNKGVLAPLPANSDFEIPLGEISVFICSRHQSFDFTPLAKGKGFEVVRRTNLLSLRRGLKEETFSINIEPDGKVTYGEMTVKNQASAGAANEQRQ